MDGRRRRKNSTCQVLVGRKHELKAERKLVFLEQSEREHGLGGSWRGPWGLSRQASWPR